MNAERRAWESVARAGLDAATLAACWALAVGARAALGAWPLASGTVRPFDVGAHLALVALVAPMFVAILAGRGDHQSPRPAPTGLLRITSSVGLGLAALALALFLLDVEWVSRTALVGFAALAVPSLAAARATRAALRRGGRGERVVLVGSGAAVGAFREAAEGPDGARVVDVIGPSELRSNPPGPAPAPRISGRSVVDASPRAAGPMPGHAGARTGVAQPDLADALRARLIAARAGVVVVVGDPPSQTALASLASACDELGLRLALDANFLGVRFGEVELREVGPYALVAFGRRRTSGLELAIKRLIDIVGALVGLALLGPLLLALMLAVRLHDPGPAIYAQRRVGRFGRVFTLYKLRSMRAGAEGELPALASMSDVDGPAFKIRQDPRVTRLGHWLRRSSLDELPQLVNVLRGDMSLVGPRPPLPAEVARYAPWQVRRLSMRPGLTGLWQVSGRSELPFERWMQLDLAYIDRWSLGLDAVVLLRTVPAVLSGRGAW